MEAEIRRTIGNCGSLRGLTERQHYLAVDLALELIRTGVRLRLDEMERE